MSRSQESRRKEATRKAKRREKLKNRPGRVPLTGRSSNTEMRDAFSLIKEGKLPAASAAIMSIARQFPNRVDVLRDLLSIAVDTEDPECLLLVSELGLKLVPRDLNFLVAHVGSSMQLGWIALALESLLTLRKYFPDEPEVQNSEDTIVMIRRTIVDSLFEPEPESDELFLLAADNERVQSAMARGDYAEAARCGERALQRRPDFTPVLNNLFQVYFNRGRLKDARTVAERSLARGSRLHPLANLARLALLEGNPEQARLYARQLQELPDDRPDSQLKKIEAFSFLGEDRAVLDIYERFNDRSAEISPMQIGLLKHYAAVAFSRTGNDAMAELLWQESLRLAPSFDTAKQNLADVQLPCGKRNGAWAFGISTWLPSVVFEESSKVDDRSGGMDKVLQRISRLDGVMSAIHRACIAMLDRGDVPGRDFALLWARDSHDDELLDAVHEFAVSTRGTDDARFRALSLLRTVGRIVDQSLPYSKDGKYREVAFQEIELHGEPSGELTGRLRELCQSAYEALHDADVNLAEKLLHDALAIEPENKFVLSNLAGTFRSTGQREKAFSIGEKVFQQWPDYFHGRMFWVMLLVEAGRLLEARQVLHETEQRTRYHFSEYAVWNRANIDLLLAEDRLEDARCWYETWKSSDPHDEHTQAAYRTRIDEAFDRRQTQTI